MPKKPQAKPAVSEPSRKIPDPVKLLLCVRAGGRCQFDGCNAYLFEHHVTLEEGTFGQLAHIVAFSEDGPRGKKGRPTNINDVSNLMLLCPRCHKLIDDHPEDYVRETLEGYKKRHEERIYHVTGLGPEQKTSILLVKSKIGDHTVTVPYDQILAAVTPRYPLSKEGLVIDLTQLPTTSSAFTTMACDTIRDQLLQFTGAAGEARKSNHISLFALAPIPILAYLGSQLSNKVPLDLYQRHRDTENWTWKESAPEAKYAFRRKQTRLRSGNVALVLSLSGSITTEALPSDVRKKFAIYEINLASSAPNPTFLKTRGDVEEFKNQYHIAIATIVRDHPGLTSIDLFPAVPAPIAVLCGRELLPKVHPAMRVHDYDKRTGGFSYQLTINE